METFFTHRNIGKEKRLCSWSGVRRGKKSNVLPNVHQPCIWCLDGGRNMLVTSSKRARHKLEACSPQAPNIARNMCTMSGEEGGGTTWKKCSQHEKSCSQHGKSVRNTMFGCWSQHARHKLATCLSQTRNIARNMYTMSGEEGGGATWKSVCNMGKGVRNTRNKLRNIILICFLIRIMWLGRCPMLAAGSDIRALAVPKKEIENRQW
jgi:hypothetical protein